MSPGEHVIKVSGDRYEAWEKRVSVEAEQMVTLEPKLKVVKGLAVIKAGANATGAKILLVSGRERRPIPKLPIKIDITTDKPWSIVATRTGFEDFKKDIVFQDGQAESTFEIVMHQKGKAPPAAAAVPAKWRADPNRAPASRSRPSSPPPSLPPQSEARASSTSTPSPCPASSSTAAPWAARRRSASGKGGTSQRRLRPRRARPQSRERQRAPRGHAHCRGALPLSGARVPAPHACPNRAPALRRAPAATVHSAGHGAPHAINTAMQLGMSTCSWA